MNHSKEFKEFVENVKKELEARFPKLNLDKFPVRERNDELFTGLTIFKNGCTTRLTVKMEPYYEQYIKGRRKDDIVYEISKNIKHEFKLSARIKNKWNQEDFEGRVLIVCLIACLFTMGICVIGFTASIFSEAARFTDYETTEAFCSVIDKSSISGTASKTHTYRYYLHVTIDGDETQEVYKMQVPSAVYRNVETGDDIKCVIYFDDDGIFDIQAWTPKRVEENDYE